MHVRIIHQYFKTPESGGGLRTYYLARTLMEAGHQVTVITAANQSAASHTIYEGIDIYALPIYYSNHLQFYSRIRAFLRFVFQSLRLLKKLPAPDVNYIVTTPLTTGIIGILGKKLLGQPYVFEVGDLWPDAPMALGVLKNPILIKLARTLEKISYKNAIGTVGLSEPISNYLRGQCPGKPTITITNFANPDLLNPRHKTSRTRDKLGFGKSDFVISYIGTIGLANNLEYFVDVAAATPAGNDVLKYVVMGAGARYPQVKAYAESRASEMLFLPHGNFEEVKDLLDASDAIYISFADEEILATGSPNKYFDGLAAGKLIITNFNGWIADEIKEHNIGFSYRPDDVASFHLMLEKYSHDKELLKAIKEKSVSLAQGKYAPKIQIKRLEEWLKEVL